MNRGATPAEMAQIIASLAKAESEASDTPTRERLRKALTVWRSAAAGGTSSGLMPVDRLGPSPKPRPDLDSIIALFEELTGKKVGPKARAELSRELVGTVMDHERQSA